MAVDKFKFISPGIFIDEIDESALPPLPERMGPLIIGRFPKGPGMRPITVNSYKEFVSVFGDPAPGNATGDIFRSGDMTAPTYAAYAAQAWLRNNSPCTVYRVMGENRTDANTYSTYTTAQAGWRTTKDFTTTETDVANVGGAYGLFIVPNPDEDPAATDSTATIQIAAAETTAHAATSSAVPAVDDTVVIKDRNGLTVTYTAKAAKDESANQFSRAGSTADAAESLMNCITSSAGHGSSITVTHDEKGILTLTQPGILGEGANITATGLHLTASSFNAGTIPHVTGTLAAIWYMQNGGIVLTGTARDGRQREGAGVYIKGTNGVFTAKIKSTDAVVAKTATFNFDRDSNLFIRKVFNTNPTETNGDVVSSTKNYWLGETFESNVVASENSLLKVTGSAPSHNNQLGVILALDGTGESGVVWGNHLKNSTPAKTGMFISQDNRGQTTASFDPTAHTDDLFRFIALDSGEHANRDYKISIMDIKAPSDNFNAYGTFTVVVRRGTDSDNTPEILERFSNCNLDTNSTRYIERVIGDRHYTWNSDNKTLVEHGNFPNKSEFVRVEVSDYVKNGNAAGALPFGVKGPVVLKTFHVVSGSTSATLKDKAGNTIDSYVAGSGSSNALADGLITTGHPAGFLVFQAPPRATGSAVAAAFEFPTSRLRISSSDGNILNGTKAFFGYQSTMKASKRYDHTNVDLLRGAPANLDPAGTVSATTQFSWVFTLDDVQEGADTSHAAYVSGSRANGTSFTAMSASGDPTTGQPFVLKKGFNRFTSPLFGGFDGFDITEKDPLRNSYLDDNQGERSNYAFYSIKKGIDMTADPEFVEFDVATVPGITNTSLNTSLILACEERADALAIIDVAGGYTPAHENTDSEESRVGDVGTAVNNVKDLNINSSYGCTFYPFVQIRDTQTDSVLYVPPSVVALGTFSSSQRKSAVWFAPAGFTRGGLSEGSSGLPVLGVRQRLTAAERDELYDANINPIASFPSEGIVIFGQKTLQVTPSALDRINVRRLMIFVKKEISRIASRILFEQNVQSTWDKFLGQVVPFLEGVQAGLGLTDFRVILDETTTTDDLIDRNILYAKIFLKPARAIEFIALDFIITRSGASFDD